MRGIFYQLLKEEMHRDENLFLVTADMGLGLIDPFRENFPNRFLNVGIAEQNMIGVASGLCNMGFRPVCYTISNFLTLRCYEQIRNDICLHDYPAILVGTSTGFDNGVLGPTHHVIDDIGAIKVLPGISIYSPATVAGIERVFEDLMQNPTVPAYVRIGKGKYEIEPLSDGINHMVIDNDSSTLIITHGVTLNYCVEAAKTDQTFDVFCMNKIRPLEASELLPLFQKYKRMIVVEDHVVNSGLYNMLCQFFVEHQPLSCQLQNISLPEGYAEKVGDKDYFSDFYGYSPDKIKQFVEVN